MMPFILACTTCFSAEEAPLIDGAKLGIVAMLAVTFAVQGGLAAFFIHLRRQSKRNADAELDHEWSELQKPS